MIIINFIIWIITGAFIGILVNKLILKKTIYRTITLGILGSIFISLIFNIIGINYKTFSLSNIIVSSIGAFIAIYCAKKQLI